ncbi:helix-turn-helix domain-containing protein [Frisingicoccus sp.]|uniref:helix-turn-helix domain-containing protein n=1 Tax=Frisingicoccus sp. TaxID=1918627 RepID=UPI003AB3A792
MSIGSRIKELRIRQNMTQEELARIIGVTKGAVANYENEVSSPKSDLMYRLFDALECDANYLYQDAMNLNIYENRATPEEFENIIKKYRNLDDYGKETIAITLERENERSKQLKLR